MKQLIGVVVLLVCAGHVTGCGTSTPEMVTSASGAVVQPGATPEIKLPVRLPLEIPTGTDLLHDEEVFCDASVAPTEQLGISAPALVATVDVAFWVITEPKVVALSEADIAAQPGLTYRLELDGIVEMLGSGDQKLAMDHYSGDDYLGLYARAARERSSHLLIGFDADGNSLLFAYGAGSADVARDQALSLGTDDRAWRVILPCGTSGWVRHWQPIAGRLGLGETADEYMALVFSALGYANSLDKGAVLQAIQETVEPAVVPPDWNDLDPGLRFLWEAPPEVQRSLTEVLFQVAIPDSWVDDPTAVLCTRIDLGWNQCHSLVRPIVLSGFIDKNSELELVLLGPEANVAQRSRSLGVVDASGLLEDPLQELQISATQSAGALLDGAAGSFTIELSDEPAD